MTDIGNSACSPLLVTRRQHSGLTPGSQLRGPYGAPGIKPIKGFWKASALATVPLLQALITEPLSSIKLNDHCTGFHKATWQAKGCIKQQVCKQSPWYTSLSMKPNSEPAQFYQQCWRGSLYQHGLRYTRGFVKLSCPTKNTWNKILQKQNLQYVKQIGQCCFRQTLRTNPILQITSLCVSHDLHIGQNQTVDRVIHGYSQHQRTKESKCRTMGLWKVGAGILDQNPL